MKPLYLTLIAICVLVVGGAYLYQRNALDDIESPAVVTSESPSTVPADAITFDIGGKNFVMRPAGEVMGKLDEEAQAFIASFIKAVNNKDLGALKSLVRPESVQCIDAVDPIFRDAHYARLISYTIPESYMLAFEPHKQVYDESFTKASEQWFKDPVEHTHTLILFYNGGPNGSETIMNRVLEKDGEYAVVLGCPTERTVTEYVTNAKALAEASKRADEVMPKLKDPLRSELKKMLGQGRFPDAMQKYVDATKEKPGTASEVLRRLMEEGRAEMQKEMEKKAPAAAGGEPSEKSSLPLTPPAAKEASAPPKPQ